MKNNSLFLLLPFICSSLVSCTSPNKTKSAGKVPAGYVTRNSGTFNLQPYKELTLENGLKIFFVRDESLPRISLTMMFKVGSVQEPSERAGLNALTAHLLEQGTQSKDALKIADEFGQLGSSLDISPGSEVTTVYADSLSASADTLLGLFTDVVLNPAFKDAEISRIRAQMVAGLQKKGDDPSAFIDDKMGKFLFENHPYARDVHGTAKSLKALGKRDIIKHYLAFYRPNNAALAVVGNFEEEFENKIQATFANWAKRKLPEIKNPAPPIIDGLKVKVLLKKGLQQTQIRIASLGISRSNEDYLRLRMANEVLGGGFASRLNQKVRDDLGLTYSINSGFNVHKEPGSFEIATFTKNETAGKTLDETLNVLNTFVKQGATEAELAASRNLLIGQFPRAIETPDRLAYNLMALDFYGISENYLTNFNKNVAAIKLAEVNSAFTKVIDPTKLKIIIYGNESIVSQFEKYKPEVEHIK